MRGTLKESSRGLEMGRRVRRLLCGLGKSPTASLCVVDPCQGMPKPESCRAPTQAPRLEAAYRRGTSHGPGGRSPETRSCDSFPSGLPRIGQLPTNQTYPVWASNSIHNPVTERGNTHIARVTYSPTHRRMFTLNTLIGLD